MNSVRTIKLFQPTELNLVNSNNVGTRNTAANIDNNNEYGYMGIAHTPLILRMGNQIGDEVGIKLFHKSRKENENTNVFKELKKDKNFKELIISTKILDKNLEVEVKDNIYDELIKLIK